MKSETEEKCGNEELKNKYFETQRISQKLCADKFTETRKKPMLYTLKFSRKVTKLVNWDNAMTFLANFLMALITAYP